MDQWQDGYDAGKEAGIEDAIEAVEKVKGNSNVPAEDAYEIALEAMRKLLG